MLYALTDYGIDNGVMMITIIMIGTILIIIIMKILTRERENMNGDIM